MNSNRVSGCFDARQRLFDSNINNCSVCTVPFSREAAAAVKSVATSNGSDVGRRRK